MHVNQSHPRMDQNNQSSTEQHQRKEEEEEEELFCSLPKASCVEWLTALQTRLQVLKVIRELLILSKLHHVIEVLHVLHHGVQLEESGRG